MKAKIIIEMERQEELKRKERLQQRLKERKYMVTYYRPNGKKLITYITSELEPKPFYWHMRKQNSINAMNGTHNIRERTMFSKDVTDYEQLEVIKKLIEEIK